MWKSEGNFVEVGSLLTPLCGFQKGTEVIRLVQQAPSPPEPSRQPKSQWKVLGESGGLVIYQVWEHCSGTGTSRKEGVSSGNRDVVVHSDKFWPEVRL